MRSSHTHSFNFRFPLKHAALLAALASAYPMQVLANAGVTQFAVGEVSLQRSTATAPLANGSRIESGDLITTGNTGRTQLRFTDGGMVSLQPNSQFKISRYADAGTAQQDSFLVDLARGGMRAITGLIGKRNRDNYKVTTTTATIGIRGSGFSMAYNPDGTLAVTTELDAIEVCTQAGCVGLNLGESALVTGGNVRPTRTRERAAWNPPSPRRLISARADDTDSQGRSAVIRLASGIAFSGVGLTGNRIEGNPPEQPLDVASPSVFQATYLDGTIAVDTGNESASVVRYRAANNDEVAGGYSYISAQTGTLAGGDLMLVGSWENAEWTGSNNTFLSQMAFVAGVPTPRSDFSAANGLRAQYNLAASTPVFSSYGGYGGELLSSSNVIVDFRSAFGAMDINLNVSMSGYEYSAGQSEPTPTPDYNLRGSATALGGGFSGTLAVTNSSGDFTGTGQAQGFFGGPNASNLGLTFSGQTDYDGTIGGAGIFTRGSQPPSSIPDTSVALNYYGSGSTQLHALDGSNLFSVDSGEGNNVFFPGYSYSSSSSAGNAVFSGTQLRSWESGGPISGSNGNLRADPVPQGATVLQYGAYGQPNESSFLGWGAWQGGLTQNSSINSGNNTNLTAVHYVIGKPAYNYDGWSGSATTTYNFIGGTNPTATSANGTVVGSIGSNSNLVVNFDISAPTVQANLFLSFNGTPVNFSQTGRVGGYYGSSGQIYSDGNAANGQFSGILSGNNAERAAIVYGLSHNSLGQIRGAAAFQTATPPTRNNND